MTQDFALQVKAMLCASKFQNARIVDSERRGIATRMQKPGCSNRSAEYVATVHS